MDASVAENIAFARPGATRDEVEAAARRPTPTSSSGRSPRATTPGRASVAAACPAASGSGSPLARALLRDSPGALPRRADHRPRPGDLPAACSAPLRAAPRRPHRPAGHPRPGRPRVRRPRDLLSTASGRRATPTPGAGRGATDDADPPAEARRRTAPAPTCCPATEVESPLMRRGGRVDTYDVYQPRAGLPRCVVKVIRPDRHGDEHCLRPRWPREGALLATLAHPHLVRGYEVVTAPRPAVVLETLHRRHPRRPDRRRPGSASSTPPCSAGSWSPRSATCTATDWLHLDVKPSNVVVQAGRAILIDLSLATRPGDGRPHAGHRRLPGARTGHRSGLSPASDVFGLGITLGEALTGDLPYGDEGRWAARHDTPPDRTLLPPAAGAGTPAVGRADPEVHRPRPRSPPLPGLRAHGARRRRSRPRPPATAPQEVNAVPGPPKRRHLAIAVGLALVSWSTAGWSWIKDRDGDEPMDPVVIGEGERANPADPECGPVLREPAGEAGDHIDDAPIVYSSTPPSFGDHRSRWEVRALSFYDVHDRPDVSVLVHNLEHGYNILWYDQAVVDDADALAQVREIADGYATVDRSPDPSTAFIAAPWTADDGDAFPARQALRPHPLVRGPNGPHPFPSRRGGPDPILRAHHPRDRPSLDGRLPPEGRPRRLPRPDVTVHSPIRLDEGSLIGCSRPPHVPPAPSNGTSTADRPRANRPRSTCHGTRVQTHPRSVQHRRRLPD